MERTATHDGEYVDIVLGYQHIVLFSLVFGALIFGTGYFVGYYRARTDQPVQHVMESTPSATPQPEASITPASVALPVTVPNPSGSGDILKDMEAAGKGDLPTSVTAEHSAPDAASPASPEPAVEPPDTAGPASKTHAAGAQTKTAVEPKASDANTASPPPAETPKKKSAPQAKAVPVKPARTETAEAAAKPRNSRGNIYLQMSSFREQQEAQKLIDDLAAQGFRALVDGQLVGGKHTVLVGPFTDFKTAVGKAKELKQQNREAFPIRR